MSEDNELERALLGSLVLRPALLESSDLRPGDFPIGRFREAFEAISTLWEQTRAPEIDPTILAERIGGNGAGTFVGSLLSGNIKIEPAGFQLRVDELRSARIRTRMRARLNGGQINVDGLRADLAELDALSNEKQEKSPLIAFPELRAMDLRVEWVVDGLVPENAVTFFYGRTTVGKTWLGLMMAEAVSAGLQLFGKATKQRPVVYVDMENPLANMKERADALQMRSMAAQLWHSTMTPRPPKLDSPDWTLYKTILPVGSLVFFDTRRSLHDGKENDDDVAALVMDRAKQLRDGGRSVIILSHPTKANERDLRGSGAWADLADHTLQFYKVRARGDAEDEGGEILAGSLLCLATGKKTRFAPVSAIYLTLTDHGLEPRDDPDPDAEAVDALAEIIAGPGYGKNQSEVISLAKKADLGGSKHRQRLIHLLARGEREGRWMVEEGLRGAKLYRPATEEPKP